LRWLLGQLDGGIALTQVGNLSQKFVQQSADRFGWDFSRPPRTEDELFDLHQQGATLRDALATWREEIARARRVAHRGDDEVAGYRSLCSGGRAERPAV